MLWQGLFIYFSTGHQRHVDLLPKEVENELPQDNLYLLESESGGFSFEKGLFKLRRGFKGKQSFKVVSVDVFLVQLFDFSHNFVVIFYFLSVV